MALLRVSGLRNTRDTSGYFNALVRDGVGVERLVNLEKTTLTSKMTQCVCDILRSPLKRSPCPLLLENYSTDEAVRRDMNVIWSSS